MRKLMRPAAFGILMTFAFWAAADTCQAQIKVINMIPQSLSGESNQDSEPNLAVNPANTKQIAATAFTPDPMGGPFAPIYKSVDGGTSWELNSILPGAGRFGTGDITLRFGGASNVLYGGILRGDSFLRLNILRTSDFTQSTPMTVLVDRFNVDQPYIQATTPTTGSGAGQDHVYVGLNDFAAAPKTSTIDRSLNAGSAPPPAGFESLRLDTRGTSGQDGPQVRTAFHADGSVYAVFYGWRGSFPAVTADVVVVRDDNWAAGSTRFADLKDPGDGLAGIRVAKSVNFTFNAMLGNDRVGGDLSIAVDPRNSSTVYIAFADVQAATGYTVHVRRSTDRGQTWSADLLTIGTTKNPALAINPLGKVALLYQHVNGSGAASRWETHIRRTTDGATWDDLILANVPANEPTPTFLPYIGDYVHLMTSGNNFCGVFSANNTPDKGNFPQGVSFQRNADFTAHKLLDVDDKTEVPISIDPFFFEVEEKDPAPHFVYEGCKGDFHLAGETGTGFYWWAGHRWLVNLEFTKVDKDFWYYSEKERPERQWAFARMGDIYDRFAVWVLPGDEGATNWHFFEYECRLKPHQIKP
jgi:hypothetical protein